MELPDRKIFPTAPSPQSRVVQKYGGTSVGSLDRIRAVARHIADTKRRVSDVVIVVSAMGEHTDDLLKQALDLAPNPPRRELDMLLSAGERISMALMSIALHNLGVSSVSLTGSQTGILTDETHGNARIEKILGDRVRDGLKLGHVVIVAGFQGVSPRTKEITTLGRGGSDLTAIALSIVLDADLCEIYKDVDGVCTADPRIVPSARVVPSMTWDGMVNLAWSGAAVLHPRGAHLAKKFSKPVEVRSSFRLDLKGTTIQGRRSVEAAVARALADKKGLTLVRVMTQSGGSQAAAASLKWLWERGETPLHTSVATSLTTKQGRPSHFLTHLMKGSLVSEWHAALEKLDAVQGTPELVTGLAAITLVGEGFFQSPETIDKIRNSIQDEVAFFDVRDDAVTIAVEESALENALRSVHGAVFS